MNVTDLLRRLVNWFLGKAPSKLETFEEEKLEGEGVTLIRYCRKTYRAYRTWRAVYKTLEYDIIFGWDTLEYMPDRPVVKKNRLSTHVVNVYKQGLHARYNPKRRVHEPDIDYLVREQEVCLEAFYNSNVLQHWRLKSRKWDKPIQTQEDLTAFIIDEIAKYALYHPPGLVDPLEINWLEVIEDITRSKLANANHVVFPVAPERGWWEQEKR